MNNAENNVYLESVIRRVFGEEIIDFTFRGECIEPTPMQTLLPHYINEPENFPVAAVRRRPSEFIIGLFIKPNQKK